MGLLGLNKVISIKGLRESKHSINYYTANKKAESLLNFFLSQVKIFPWQRVGIQKNFPAKQLY